MTVLELLKRLPCRFSPGVVPKVLVVREIEGLPRKTLTLKLAQTEPHEFLSQTWLRRLNALENNARFCARNPGAPENLLLFRDLAPMEAIYCGSKRITDDHSNPVDLHLVRVGESL